MLRLFFKCLGPWPTLISSEQRWTSLDSRKWNIIEQGRFFFWGGWAMRTQCRQWRQQASRDVLTPRFRPQLRHSLACDLGESFNLSGTDFLNWKMLFVSLQIVMRNWIRTVPRLKAPLSTTSTPKLHEQICMHTHKHNCKYLFNCKLQISNFWRFWVT